MKGAVALGLVLKMNYERGRVPVQAGLDDQVGLAPVRVEEVGEGLLVEEDQALAVDLDGQLGGEQLQKFDEELGQQELE